MEKKLAFRNRNEFRSWLMENHDDHDAVWLVFGKGGSTETLHPDEALKEALCFGWIDGLIKKVDEECYIKRFSHRRKKSVWSVRNRNFAEKLISEGLMTEFGMEEIKRARKNGGWDRPDSPALTETQIQEFTELVRGNEPAYSNLMKMFPSVVKTYAMHYTSAKKEETRKRRLLKIIERLNDNLKPM